MKAKKYGVKIDLLWEADKISFSEGGEYGLVYV
jgi:hypothetical protein